jgi:bifunctional non-homologous end joining protein LigD
MRLGRSIRPFDDSAWLYELKWDGFRALAAVQKGSCDLISRNGRCFRSWPHLQRELARLPVSNCIIDGEIVCLGEDGKADFNSLLFRRSSPYFYAFDLLWLNGNDLRSTPLLRRKHSLAALLQRSGADIRYVEHFPGGQGTALFELCCSHDLEGVVAKRSDSTYLEDDQRQAWLKIKNPDYTGAAGRHELFERRPISIPPGDASPGYF